MAIVDKRELSQIDHIAIPVEDIENSIKWYSTNFNCQVTYQDETWAFIQFGNIKLALVIPEEHPAHIAFVSEKADSFGNLKTHRDGTRSVYVRDPNGNFIEVMAPHKEI